MSGEEPVNKPHSLAVPIDLSLVRTAKPADYEQIMQLCIAMHAEAGLYAFDITKVGNAIRNCTAMDGGIIGLIGNPKPVAIMILSIGVFNSKRTAQKAKMCQRQLQMAGSLFLHNAHLASFRADTDIDEVA